MYYKPGETKDEYAERYREAWTKQRDRLYMGTTALAKIADISRDEPDYFVAWEEVDDHYIGNWITGFGFINVRFPKDTSRPVTDEEFEWFLDHPTVMA